MATPAAKKFIVLGASCTAAFMMFACSARKSAKMREQEKIMNLELQKFIRGMRATNQKIKELNTELEFKIIVAKYYITGESGDL